MKIKKYEATTEYEAIEKVKMELGKDAFIINIKKIQPKGIFVFFKKPRVEITAAYEEKSSGENSTLNQNKTLSQAPNSIPNPVVSPNQAIIKEANEIKKEKKLQEQQAVIQDLEKKLNSTEDLLSKVMIQLSASSLGAEQKNNTRRYDNTVLQLFHDTLTEQGVLPEIVDDLLGEINETSDINKLDINLIVRIVYNKIISIIGTPETVNLTVSKNKNTDKKVKTIIFMGPTGVGKTTTIAKLSSKFILDNAFKVSLITADTYRIAAVEQLKTYAQILGIEVGIVFNPTDLTENIQKMKVLSDVILIDTAGRSHKNMENFKELESIIMQLEDSEKYLVLSITTKYEDLINIIRVYSDVTEYKIIFTKLDETTCLGSILNICYVTGKKISYVTTGQNVPDDIEVIKPEKIAKSLLGLEE